MEVLTPEEASKADGLASAHGVSLAHLMQRAGDAVARIALQRFGAATRIHVLCGPGNNGGDGYVAAGRLADAGCDVRVWRSREPRDGSEAFAAAMAWRGETLPISEFKPKDGELVIDALYGAGLTRALGEEDVAALKRAEASGCDVLAVDLPSGICGASGSVLGHALHADVTVTFFRKKPGHLLYPGREYCGDLFVEDIGLPELVLQDMAPSLWENGPAVWRAALPRPDVTSHKYSRGHVAVASGGMTATGAARLAAAAAARGGAGAVTVLSPPDAVLANSAHLTATMLRGFDDVEMLPSIIGERRMNAVVCGPGLGTDDRQADVVAALLGIPDVALVLDADAITLLARGPALLAGLARRQGATVLTPHEGEFRRLFPDLAEDNSMSKVQRARGAAQRLNSVVTYKGADTVIAAPDGRAAINSNGTVWLATAGSGDVLAGLTAALLSQNMPAFEAACAAVWIHAEAGSREGFGLTAEDLPQAARRVLAELLS